jgi:hypothetical protein
MRAPYSIAPTPAELMSGTFRCPSPNHQANHFITEEKMSLPVFFQRYQNGELATIKRSVLIDILGSAAVMDGPNIGAIRFSDSDGGEVYGADNEDIEQLSFDEGDGKKFFDALWEIADRTGAFMYWIGDGSCSAVTDKAILDHVPADVLADTGPAKIVKNGKQLSKCLSQGFDFG